MYVYASCVQMLINKWNLQVDLESLSERHYEKVTHKVCLLFVC